MKHAQTTQHDIKFAHINIRSLRNKIHEIHTILSTHDIHVLSINETWLDDSISDATLQIPGYILYRHDRTSRGGGVCFYVETTNFYVLVLPRHTDAEMLMLLIDLPTGTRPAEKIIACSVYRPPGSVVSYWENICTELDSLDSRYNIIVLGDLNVDTLTPSTNLRHLSSLCSEFHIVNAVHVPTRFPSSTALDVALCSHDLPRQSTQVIPIDGISDHYLVIVSLQYQIPYYSNSHVISVRKPGLHRLDFTKLTSDLCTKTYNSIAPDKSLHDNASSLTKCITSTLVEHSSVCKVLVPNRKRPQPQPWIDLEIRGANYQRRACVFLPIDLFYYWGSGSIMHSFHFAPCFPAG